MVRNVLVYDITWTIYGNWTLRDFRDWRRTLARRQQIEEKTVFCKEIGQKSRLGSLLVLIKWIMVNVPILHEPMDFLKNATMTQKPSNPKISRLAAVAVTALFCSSGETSAASSNVGCESTAIQQIERYCSKSWQTAHIPRDEWGDSTQQVMAELLERIPRERLPAAIGTSASEERRELNRSIWRIVKRWVRRHRHVPLESFDAPVVANESPSQVDDQIEQVLRVASAKLSDQQRRIIELLKEGFSVAEIAQRMDLPANRISNEKHRAIKQIRRYLCDVA
ncbi:MAG: sigma-70 family RNA polymerase sigma factor [Pirellulaceae bacterium]